MAEDHVSMAIHLDQGDCTVRAGQEISGLVHLFCAESVLRVLNMQISLRGEAKASWVSKVSDKIFDTVQCLVEQVDNNQSVPLQNGNVQEKLSIPFKFSLPADLPSSLETKVGFIHYNVYASVDVQLSQVASCFASSTDRQFRNFTTLRTVPVVALVEKTLVDTMPSVRTKQQEQFQEVTCCVSTSLFILEMEVDQHSASAGEVLNVRVTITNRSRRQLTSCSLLLVQQACVSAKSRYEDIEDCRTIAKETCSTELPNVPAEKTLNQTVNLKIPQETIPSTVRPCIIVVSYSLLLRVRGGRFHQIDLPIYLSNA